MTSVALRIAASEAFRERQARTVAGAKAIALRADIARYDEIEAGCVRFINGLVPAG